MLCSIRTPIISLSSRHELEHVANVCPAQCCGRMRKLLIIENRSFRCHIWVPLTERLKAHLGSITLNLHRVRGPGVP